MLLRVLELTTPSDTEDTGPCLGMSTLNGFLLGHGISRIRLNPLAFTHFFVYCLHPLGWETATMKPLIPLCLPCLHPVVCCDPTQLEATALLLQKLS